MRGRTTEPLGGRTVDGSVVEVWADGFSREGEHYTFSSLFDLEDGEELPADALVIGETPSSAARVILGVARFRKEQWAGDLPTTASRAKQHSRDNQAACQAAGERGKRFIGPVRAVAPAPVRRAAATAALIERRDGRC